VDGGKLKLEVMSVVHTQLATFPHAFPGVRLVTCKSGMSPPGTGNDVLRRILEWELDSTETLSVGGTSIRPADFIAAFLSSPTHAKAIRPQLERYSAFQVTVKGRKKGQLVSKTYTCHDPKVLATTRTCALAAEMLARGDFGPGVVTPESINPDPFINQALSWGMVIEGL
jgi:saccharopine dehydrogenase-like NADP-dependent oxidoreductase